MQTMSYRTTFALDGVTMRRLKNLAARWQVSQAESESPPDAVDPLAALKAYHAQGGLDRGKAEAYLRAVREDREHWRPS